MNHRQKYNEFVAKQDLLTESLDLATVHLNKAQKDFDDYTKAIELIGLITMSSQDYIKSFLENLVAEALQSIFGIDYGFELDFQLARNTTEVNLYVVKEGVRRSIRDEDLGGGVADLVSFILRVVFWAIQPHPTRSTIILDEPLKFLDKERLELFGTLLHEISKQLDIQFIVITHEESIAEQADTAYYVKAIKKEVSIVERII